MNLNLFYSLSRVTLKLLLKTSLFILPVIPVLGEPLRLNGVKYLLPDGKGFSEVSDIVISGNTVAEIKKSEKNETEYFVTPSFCDSYVTLGADSRGGLNYRKDIQVSLKSFIVHGFTAIQSVGDDAWVGELQKNETANSPVIFRAGKPLIPEAEETGNLNRGMFHPVKTDGDAMTALAGDETSGVKNIYLFHRYHGSKEYPLNASVMYRMNSLLGEKNKNLVASTFTDRYSIIESLAAGIRYIHHPVPDDLESRYYTVYLPEIKWLPMLSVYYFQSRTVEELNRELAFMNGSDFFKEHYSGLMNDLINSFPTRAIQVTAASEFDSFIRFFKNHRLLEDNMILAGGSGYYYQFPGMAGINEMKQLFAAGMDGEKILRMASENTCAFIGAGEKKIRKGNQADLLLFKKNPALSAENLLSLGSVIKNGVLVYSAQSGKPESVKKKRGKNGRKKKK